MGFEIFAETFDGRQGLACVFPVDQNRSAVSQIERNTWNSRAKFFFADEFRMEFSQEPNDRNDVVQTLVVRNDYERNATWDFFAARKGISCTDDTRACHEEKIKNVHAFLVRLVSDPQANPLNRMKNQQAKPEKEIIND